MESAPVNGYFDANATTPLHPAAREAWLQVADRHWRNPSSLYPAAAAAREQLEDARWRLAELIGSEPESLVFTSGATESNNALFRALADRHTAGAGDGWVWISAIEHPAVHLPAHRNFPGRVDRLPTDSNGYLRLDLLEQRLASGPPPLLVSVMAANNETGGIQPWGEVARLCRQAGVEFHCDASQWLGKMPAAGLHACDWLTGSGHKFGGPKGIGFLKLPDDIDWQPAFQVGGAQQQDRRAGTEDVAGALAMVTALEQRAGLVDDPDWRHQRAGWRDRFEQVVGDRLPGAVPLAAAALDGRLWNTSMLRLPGGRNVKWLTRLARLGFEVSTGSACSAGAGKPSLVLAAMDLPEDAMPRVLRFSSLWETEETDWQQLADALAAVAAELVW